VCKQTIARGSLSLGAIVSLVTRVT